MNEFTLIYIIIMIPSIILNVKWVYHLQKAIPFARSGNVDKTQIRIAIKYITGAFLYGVASLVFVNLLLARG